MQVRQIRTRWPQLPYLMVDGGIKGHTAPLAAAAGANVLVAGSYLFAPGRMSERLRELQLALIDHGQ